jgi:hypothetical protein
MSSQGSATEIAAETANEPAGLVWVVGIVMAIVAGAFAGGMGLANELTPIRCAIVTIATIAGGGTGMLTIVALINGLRWGLLGAAVWIGYQAVVAILIIAGAHPAISRLPEDLALLVGIAAAFGVPLIASRPLRWWAVRPARRSSILLALTVASICVAAAGQAAATSIPDPTQVSADALSLRATATCEAGSVTVGVDVTWSRTDPWPEGPFGHMSDHLAILLDLNAPGSGAPTGSVANAFAWTVTDLSPQNSAAPVTRQVGAAKDFTPPAWGTGENYILYVDHEALQAGHDYHFVGTSRTSLGDQLARRLFVDYRHGNRFEKSLQVACTS